MRITIIGYGRMGREVERLAIKRGHEIVLKIDKDNTEDIDSDQFMKSNVAIEFTRPETAYENITGCIHRGVPLVSGTTGWTTQLPRVKDLLASKGGSFLYASNFSIGVNILFSLNRKLAAIMNGLPDYNVEIGEIHHTMKKDSPSGTAISLAGDIINECERYESWHPDETGNEGSIRIHSDRIGQVTGTHKVKWNSDIDAISLEHESYNRQGFALGAVIAAEFIHKRKGFFTMTDLLGF
ncbi:MAG: 4-hydroxy-tetrahydrodipicolinate reductase [Bacteroidales bacterium]|nr:4-hydroxy-tetrahydrodipicolinate reductase [Bacteroidales bacterium]